MIRALRDALGEDELSKHMNLKTLTIVVLGLMLASCSKTPDHYTSHAPILESRAVNVPGNYSCSQALRYASPVEEAFAGIGINADATAERIAANIGALKEALRKCDASHTQVATYLWGFASFATAYLAYHYHADQSVIPVDLPVALRFFKSCAAGRDAAIAKACKYHYDLASAIIQQDSP
jgi:hypothetical protein